MRASVSIGHAAPKHQQKHQEDDYNGPARDNCASEKVSGVHDSLTFKSRRGGLSRSSRSPSSGHSLWRLQTARELGVREVRPLTTFDLVNSATSLFLWFPPKNSRTACC